MNKELVICEAEKILKKHLPRGYKFLIFGSWSRGDALPTSDIDIGILGKKKVPHDTMMMIREEAENIPTLRSVDIVDLNSVEESFKNNVLEYARPI